MRIKPQVNFTRGLKRFTWKDASEIEIKHPKHGRGGPVAKTTITGKRKKRK